MRREYTRKMSSSDEPTGKTKDKAEPADDQGKVHSANSWESADLGDDDRNKKFLKLMGASKSEHHGRFIIGEKEVPKHLHARDRKETEEINHELEEQFKHTMEHRVTKWSHKGLGFENQDETGSIGNVEKPTDKNNTSISESQKSDEKAGEKDDTPAAAKDDSASKKRDSSEPVKNTEIPTKKPKMMMNFVKSSD